MAIVTKMEFTTTFAYLSKVTGRIFSLEYSKGYLSYVPFVQSFEKNKVTQHLMYSIRKGNFIEDCKNILFWENF